MLAEDKNDKRISRHHITQEDFTPSSVVNELVDKLSPDVFVDFSKKILDTSAGVGNLLIEVLNRRLKNCDTITDVFNAISSIYGVEIMADNVCECRERLYNKIVERFPSIINDKILDYEVKRLLKINIVWYDSLLYDFSFPQKIHHYDLKNGNVNVLFTEKDKSKGKGKYPMWTIEQEHIQQTLF